MGLLSTVVPKWGASLSDGCPQMWDNHHVEAGGAGGERIHLRKNKGIRSLLNAQQGGGGQDSIGKAVCKEAKGGWLFLKGEGEEVRPPMEFSLFLVIVPGCK